MTTLNELSSSGFVALINRGLADAPWARRRLADHADATVEIVCAPMRLYFQIDESGVLSALPARPENDLSLEIDVARLGSEWIEGGLERAMHAVRVQGNAELADTLSFVARNADPDLEETLARMFGDVAAHRLGGALRHAWSEFESGLQGTAGNLGEYLSNDSGLLVARSELPSRRADISRLRDNLARLDKRIQRLTRR